jgi:hypothetical protein
VDEKRRKEESITYISKDSGGYVDEKRGRGEEGERSVSCVMCAPL